MCTTSIGITSFANAARRIWQNVIYDLVLTWITWRPAAQRTIYHASAMPNQARLAVLFVQFSVWKLSRFYHLGLILGTILANTLLLRLEGASEFCNHSVEAMLLPLFLK